MHKLHDSDNIVGGVVKIEFQLLPDNIVGPVVKIEFKLLPNFERFL